MPKFTDQLSSEIITRFLAVAPKAECSLCHASEFMLGSGITLLDVQQNYPDRIMLGGAKHMPCIGVICKVCGNTYLVNLKVLGGLDHLLEADEIAAEAK